MIRFLALMFILLSPAAAKQVHVVFGNHLDIGFNNIEPLIGYDNNVLNKYFNQYLPLAVDVSDAMQRESPHQDRYIYTTHSYLMSLFLDCPDNMGLECPSAETREKVVRGIETGAITWHAHPHNAQYELYDESLLRYSFDFTHELDARFGFEPKHTAILRDVPGLTRAAIPILVSQGIRGISVGVNGGSAPPGVPHYTPFIWRDEESQTEIIAFWHPGGYGGYQGSLNLDPPDHCIQAPGHDHVLCTSWRNDNDGPPVNASEPMLIYELLRKDWGGNTTQNSSSSSSSVQQVDDDVFNIEASSFDAYLDALISAIENENLRLPVVTSEIGDTWIFGVQSDPLKTANFRAISRFRSACIDSPRCPSRPPRLEEPIPEAVNEAAGFDELSRMLLKVPEHTWGVDVKKTLNDFVNYSNVDFHQCLPPPVPNALLSTAAAAAASASNAASSSSSSDLSDGVPMREAPCMNYQHCIHAWDRQAAYIDWGVKALPSDHPVVQAYSADVAARQQLAAISHESLMAAGARSHTTPAAVGFVDSTSSSSSHANHHDQHEDVVIDSGEYDEIIADDDDIQDAPLNRKFFPASKQSSLMSQRHQQQQEEQQQQEQSQQEQEQLKLYKCGSWKFMLDETQGALTSLRKLYGSDHSQDGNDWVGSSSSSSSSVSGGVLGQLVYSGYSEASYDFIWNHYAWQQPLPWWFPLDFGKVNSSVAWDKEVHVPATLENVYENITESGDLQQLSLKFTYPQELVQNLGAPRVMGTTITCPHSSNDSSSSSSDNHISNDDLLGNDDDETDDLQVTVVWQDKTPTRLPEALWFSFIPDPAAVDVDSWRMHKLGGLIDPQDVIINGSQSIHAVSDKGIQVLSADRSELLQIKTLDTALVSPGRYNPFPNGKFKPEMEHGMHFNLMNNIWGTNYIMWVPYSEKDVNMAFRFALHAEQVYGA